MNKPTIEEFIDFCAMYENIEVGYTPYNQGSWRGIYDEPCIFITEGSSILSDFIPYCQNLFDGRLYNGWKGGQYRYNPYSLLNFEANSSCYSGDYSMFIELLSSNEDVNVTKLWLKFIKGKDNA